jgi:hypothetical protein
MKSFSIVALLSIAACVKAQPTISALSHASIFPPDIAPGEIITLSVQGIDAGLTDAVHAPAGNLPTTLAGFGVLFRQTTDMPAPVLEIRPIPMCPSNIQPQSGKCATAVAITIQVPLEVVPMCFACASVNVPLQVAVNFKGTLGPFIEPRVLSDQVHILTACDVVVSGITPTALLGGFPCDPMITHANGTLVTSSSPAKAGEQLVAYAVGLGQTNPPQVTGQPAKISASTASRFWLDYNYRRNALATQPQVFAIDPPSSGPLPSFAGVTAGFVGLYQINFTVPAPPAGVLACDLTIGFAPYGNYVRSNLTVSIGGPYSFDGTGICVTPVN